MFPMKHFTGFSYCAGGGVNPGILRHISVRVFCFHNFVASYSKLVALAGGVSINPTFVDEKCWKVL